MSEGSRVGYRNQVFLYFMNLMELTRRCLPILKDIKELSELIDAPVEIYDRAELEQEIFLRVKELIEKCTYQT